MSEESLSIQLGYTKSTRKYLVHAVIVTAGTSILMAYFKYPNLIPLLFVVCCMMGEMWWKTRKSMQLVKSGIELSTGVVAWEDIIRCTCWGPVGIPLTPFKYQGYYFYLKDGGVVSLNSTYRGFDQLEYALEKKKFPTSEEPAWYQYPPLLIRVCRYLLAFIFSILYVIILSFLPFLALSCLIYGYYRYQKYRKAKEEGNALPEDIWISVMGTIAIGASILLLIKFETVQFLIGFAPVALVLWYPYKLEPFAIISNTLFVGENKAYPLRHLRSSRDVSKLFVFKYWKLNFANGNIDIYPLLENYPQFKQKLEKDWDDVQTRLQGKEYTPEEAEILAPEEEAKRVIEQQPINN